MSTTRTRPRLVSVHVVRWERPEGMYGVRCDYDDGVDVAEMWGTKEEAELMADIRRREIFTDANLKRINVERNY